LAPAPASSPRPSSIKGVKPENLVSVEYSHPFVQHLTAKYPGVNFINGDAFNLAETLKEYEGQKFDCVIRAFHFSTSPCMRASS
jgi:phosphatidylethanolamine/phosphatidyl-N-methylethanolamine N-methyltransferase